MNPPSEWIATVPPDRNEPVWLMTIMGQVVIGKWKGYYGQFYVAWAPLEPGTP